MSSERKNMEGLGEGEAISLWFSIRPKGFVPLVFMGPVSKYSER